MSEVDVSKFSLKAEKHDVVTCLADLSQKAKMAAIEAGMVIDEHERSGSFFQADHSVLFERSLEKGLEIMDIEKAKKLYGLEEYWWKAVDRNKDKYTKLADKNLTHGYFLRAKAGVKCDFPLQACLYMEKGGIAQCVHNVIVAEEGSELNIISGCAVGKSVKDNLHVGVSEFYVKKGAKLTFTMIHNWNETVDVRPRSVAVVEEGGTFISNYIALNPVRNLQMYPVAICKEDSTVRFNNLLRARGNSLLDVGSKVILEGRGAKAELVSRSIAQDTSKVVARGYMVGNAPDVKGHLECNGLLLNDGASILAVPELEGSVKNIDLSHEASVGKLAPEEIRYLMARGLDEETATSVLVRGFLKVELPGMPARLKRKIDAAIEASSKGL